MSQRFLPNLNDLNQEIFKNQNRASRFRSTANLAKIPHIFVSYFFSLGGVKGTANLVKIP